MAKKSNNGLIKLIGIGAIFFYFAKTAINKVLDTIEVGTPRFSSIPKVTLQGIKGTLNVPILNKTAISIPIDHLKGGFYFSGVLLGSFDLSNFEIDANTETLVQLPIDIGWGALGSQVENILNGTVNLELQVVGTMTAKGIRLPIDEKIKLL